MPEGFQVNYVLVAETGLLGTEMARASQITTNGAGHCNEQATHGKVYF